ncbi:hypothetical protein BDB01DRAFT_814386 [Pilobolus umbonatus]|nr:hypothetical protein BDB01DRAFT_814386 [Pilobolus umbonatus]
MDSLPHEVLKMITSLIDPNDYLGCLTVNRKWYSIFISHLYHVIKPKSDEKVMLFLESMATYSRTKEAGKYVTKINMLTVSSSQKFRVHSPTPIDFIDALANCPNIEELNLLYEESNVTKLMSKRMPILKKLKSVGFYRRGSDSILNKHIMDFQHKHRSSVTHLKMSSEYSNADQFTEYGMLSYISSFSQLVSLSLDISKTPLADSSILHDILDQCPHLVSLYYKAHSLKSASACTITPYPSLQAFLLRVDQFNLEDTKYIQQKMPGLINLTVETNMFENSKEAIFNQLLAIPTINALKVKMNLDFCEDMYGIFWNYASQYPQPNYKKSIFSTSTQTNPFYSEFTIKKRENIALFNYTIDNKRVNYYSYLQKTNQSLNELVIHDVDWEAGRFELDIDTTLTHCPSLTHLDLSFPKVNIPKTMNSPHKSLQVLKLKGGIMNEHRLDRLAKLCPSIQSLTFLGTFFTSNSKGNFIIPLRFVKLNSLNIHYFHPSKTVLVVKENEGELHRLWYRVPESECMALTERENIMVSVLNFYTKPAILFTSATVEQVHVV